MMRIRVMMAVFAAAVLLPYVASAQATPTLGELAKKEEERRKAQKAAGKVLTNQDLPRGTAPPAPGAAAAPAASAEKPADKPAEKTEDPAKEEAAWRQRMTQAREELRRNEMFAEALQTRINSLTNDFAMRDDPYQRARVAEDRSKALLELERVKADVEQTRKKISGIEEEARRAGVPPGWLR